jgi:hypothetical protein
MCTCTLLRGFSAHFFSLGQFVSQTISTADWRDGLQSIVHRRPSTSLEQSPSQRKQRGENMGCLPRHHYPCQAWIAAEIWSPRRPSSRKVHLARYRWRRLCAVSACAHWTWVHTRTLLVQYTHCKGANRRVWRWNILTRRPPTALRYTYVQPIEKTDRSIDLRRRRRSRQPTTARICTCVRGCWR